MKDLLSTKIIFILLLSCFSTIINAQNVIIVVVDGARYSETFGAGSNYIPHLYNDLKPLGTLYTDFRIDYPSGYTETCPGHSAIETGTWQPIENDGSERPTKPTFFEYIRKEDGNPQSDCYAVTGKSKLDILTYSSFSGYGSEYGGVWVGDDERDDALTYSKLIDVMQNYHPKIIVVNFAQVDDVAHTGNWNGYLSAITNADSYIFELWQHIENNDWGYSPENTTIFITDDHGRHDDSHGGFQNHGDGCEGCTHIMLLAVGRNILPNQVINDTHWQIDIAPTAGLLLNFQTPYAIGSSLLSSFQLTVEVQDGWNLVSVPGIHPEGQSVDDWWTERDLSASVFEFTNGYQVVTSVEPGKGYWMKNMGDVTYNTGDEWPVEGIELTPHNPLNAVSGWNLIGGYENIVQTSSLTTIPSGLINSPVYSYSNGYQIVDNLIPGHGYWIKLSANGSIDLSGTSSFKPNNYFPDDAGRIIFTDSKTRTYTLYAVNKNMDLSFYDLPPKPPAGRFDIRYSSNRIAECLINVKTIELSGVNYPVNVKSYGITLNLEINDSKNNLIILNPGDEVTINSVRDNKISISGLLQIKEFSLSQNYPNPFNPTTTIKYTIPNVISTKGRNLFVTLKVYDVLGNEVATLVNEEKPAGSYAAKFNGSRLASGIYFYQIKAGDYTTTKKLILLK